MKLILVFAIAVGVVYSVDMPPAALNVVRDAGTDILSAKVSAYSERLYNAGEAYRSANVTCNRLVDQAITNCRACAKSKCEARMKSVCEPSKWEKILGKTISFFKDKIPTIFKKKIPDILVKKIGGGIVDVTKDVGKFLKNKVVDKIGDFGKKATSGIIKIGTGAIKGVVDVGKKIGSGVVDAGKKVVDHVKKVTSKIASVGRRIGKTFRRVFGKRSLDVARVRERRQSAPDCKAFENDGNNACQYYVQPQYCSTCVFDSNTGCPGYKAAVDELRAANAARDWMSGIKSKNYDITRISYNPASISPKGGFNNVFVSVNLFGKALSFTMRQPMNPYIPNVAGPAIALRALEEYRK